jgi:hypothetical protein
MNPVRSVMPPKAPNRSLRQPRTRRKKPTEPRLLKGFLLAAGAAAILMFSFVTVGMALEVGPAGLLRKFAPAELRTVVTAPIAVDLGGYSVRPGKRDRYVWVTVAMKVPGPRQEAEICRMMPRLRAVIVQELGDKMRETPDDTGAVAPALIDFARQRITQALDTDVGGEFGLLVLTDWRGAPFPSCPREADEEL